VEGGLQVQLALEAQREQAATVQSFVEGVEKQKALIAFCGDKPQKKRSPKFNFGAKLTEVEDMLARDPKGENGVWQEARPGHFVALFARWFLKTYGVADAEVGRQATAGKICTQAARLVNEEFAGDPRGLVRYMAWVFQQARAWEEKARERGSGDVFRVSWYYVFAGRKALTDYRIAIARVRECD
jgi:hypothetical protein